MRGMRLSDECKTKYSSVNAGSAADVSGGAAAAGFVPGFLDSMPLQAGSTRGHLALIRWTCLATARCGWMPCRVQIDTGISCFGHACAGMLELGDGDQAWPRSKSAAGTGEMPKAIPSYRLDKVASSLPTRQSRWLGCGVRCVSGLRMAPRIKSRVPWPRACGDRQLDAPLARSGSVQSLSLLTNALRVGPAAAAPVEDPLPADALDRGALVSRRHLRIFNPTCPGDLRLPEPG